MNQLFEDFAKAHAAQNGYQLAQTLAPVPPADNPNRLLAIVQGSNSYSLKGDVKHFIELHAAPKGRRPSVDKHELKGWIDVYMAYWKALEQILAGQRKKAPNTWTKVYEAWKELTSILIRGYNNHNFPAWTIPSLYMVGKYLRLFAIKSDEERVIMANSTSSVTTFNPMQEEFEPDMDTQGQLRDCEQHLKRIFTLCLNDRAPLEESRKWGIYFIVNLLFKTYFKLNSASLSRNILKTLAVYVNKGDIPPLELFPKSQRVTFKYYEGVLFFLEEDYLEAEKHLTEAWCLCHKDADKQIERILTYLIPCRLLTSHVLPTDALLKKYPQLKKTFAPIAKCIKSGHLRAFDDALLEREDEFVKRRIYLTLERSRDIVLRNLLRKVFLLGGYDEPKEGETVPVRRTRIPELEFRTAISVSSDVPLGRGRPGLMIDQDEVECMLANMIYKDYMKGYIARERGIVVLSKKGAFPGTGV